MIRVEHVSKSFPQAPPRRRVIALHDFSLTVRAGEFVCLLGPSGCGKTTLLNLIAGFDRPDSGRVLFAGREVSGPGPDRAVVFQDPALFPWLTARGNVEFALRTQGLPARERRERAIEILELVGLAGFENARPYQLSGGMRQRVALARVLAMRPAGLLLDEPFGALDAITRERLQEELVSLLDTERKPVVFVTHDVREAAFLADRVVIMGTPPQSRRAEIAIPLPRPRIRDSQELTAIVAGLDSALREIVP